MLECPKTAQMKDFLKLFKTVMDFKGLSFIVTEQPFNKKLRPVFYFATVITRYVQRSVDPVGIALVFGVCASLLLPKYLVSG